jgi:hypothetical protein
LEDCKNEGETLEILEFLEDGEEELHKLSCDDEVNKELGEDEWELDIFFNS